MKQHGLTFGLYVEYEDDLQEAFLAMKAVLSKDELEKWEDDFYERISRGAANGIITLTGLCRWAKERWPEIDQKALKESCVRLWAMYLKNADKETVATLHDFCTGPEETVRNNLKRYCGSLSWQGFPSGFFDRTMAWHYSIGCCGDNKANTLQKFESWVKDQWPGHYGFDESVHSLWAGYREWLNAGTPTEEQALETEKMIKKIQERRKKRKDKESGQ